LSAGTDDPDPEPLLNGERQRTLIAAERTWAKFKDAQCSAKYKLIAPGTGAAALSARCAIALLGSEYASSGVWQARSVGIPALPDEQDGLFVTSTSALMHQRSLEHLPSCIL
jgi:hypothetical protein